MLRLLDSGGISVFVAFVDALFGNYTIGPLHVSFMFVSTTMSSVRQQLLDAPLSDFDIIVVC